MALTMMSWVVAIPLLGIATGLRSMTGIMVLCWFAYTGALPVEGTWASWTGKLGVAAFFTLCALGEYVADKLPKTPNRTAPLGLITRLVVGGLLGAVAATGLAGSAFEGILLGAIGALLGTFGGFHIRHYLVQRTGCPDWVLAVCEDVVAVLCCVFSLSIVTG